jgi:aerobic-type carbon monoxide dehydrogenase small subunit (CoxS/CutS family)
MRILHARPAGDRAFDGRARLPAGDDTLTAHLSGGLCRCTGYVNILKAVRSLLADNAAT